MCFISLCERQEIHMGGTKRDRFHFEIVLRHLGLERKLADLKVNGKNYYAFTPYSLDGLCGLDNHMSYHADGERHVKSRYRRDGEMVDAPELFGSTAVQFGRPENLNGAVPLYLSGDPLNQFRKLRPFVGGKGAKILIDAERADFRECPFFIQIYVVGGRNAACVPVPPGAGPRILSFIKKTDPWIA